MPHLMQTPHVWRLGVDDQIMESWTLRFSEYIGKLIILLLTHSISSTGNNRPIQTYIVSTKAIQRYCNLRKRESLTKAQLLPTLATLLYEDRDPLCS